MGGRAPLERGGGRSTWGDEGPPREKERRRNQRCVLKTVPESGCGRAPHEGGLEATVGPGGGAEGARLGLFPQEPGRPWARDISG